MVRQIVIALFGVLMLFSVAYADTTVIEGDPVQVISQTPGSDGEVFVGSDAEEGLVSLSDGSSNKLNIYTTPMSSDWNFKLPPDNGDPNEVLTTDGSGNSTWEPVAAGYNRVQEEGSNLTQRLILNFVGAGFTAADDGATKTNVSLDDDLNAISQVATNGYLKRTGVNTWAIQATPIPIADGGTNNTSFNSTEIPVFDGTSLQGFSDLSFNTSAGSHRLLIGNGTSGPGTVRLLENGTNGSNYAAVAAAANIAFNVLHIVPATNAAGLWGEDATGAIVQRTLLAVVSGSDLAATWTNPAGDTGDPILNLVEGAALASPRNHVDLGAANCTKWNALGLNGAGVPTYKMANTGLVDLVQFSCRMPDNYTGGSIMIHVYGTSKGLGPPGNARFEVSLGTLSDLQPDPAGLISAASVITQVMSPAVESDCQFSLGLNTPQGTPAAGEKLEIYFYRNSGHVTDNYTGDFYLEGIQVEYPTNSNTE